MKTYILKTDNGEYFINDTKIIYDKNTMKKVASENCLSAALVLGKHPGTPETVAKALKISKKAALQALEELQKAGLVDVVRSLQKKPEKSQYRRTANSVSFEYSDANVKLDLREKGITDEQTAKFYRKFIKDNKFDGYICVGSADPHGEYKAIARDTHYALYLSMFLGHFVDLPKTFPIVLDTDVIAKNLFKNNLIVVGGPVTNLVTRDINTHLPVKFVKEEGWALKDKNGIHSRDYEGVIESIKNPFDKTKDIVLLGGVRHVGTLSAILAGTKFSKLTFRDYNEENTWSVLVRGYDIDGDGEIDSVELMR